MVQGKGNIEKVNFSVSASSNIHLSLSRDGSSSNYEILLGGWGGFQSVIRTSHQGETVVTLSHSKEDFDRWRVNFQLRVLESSIGIYDSVGVPIIQFTGIDTSDIVFVFITTGWGSTGEWTINPSSCIGRDTELDTADIYTQLEPVAYCRAYAIAFDWCPHRAHACFPNVKQYDADVMETENGKNGLKYDPKPVKNR